MDTDSDFSMRKQFYEESKRLVLPSYIHGYLTEIKHILSKLDVDSISNLINELAVIRSYRGRVFCLGVGGGASIASHAVGDFRKLCEIEAYSPMDNVAELTARINDKLLGWDHVFVDWLTSSHLCKKDGILVFSVGGGSFKKSVSQNIAFAIEYAIETKAKVLGIVGYNGGYTAKCADACVKIPKVNGKNITAHTEGMQSVILHLIVNFLKVKEMKWESLEK